MSALERAMREAFATLEVTYRSPAFIRLLDELWALPQGSSRHQFVRDTLLSPRALRARGVELPEGVELQRTWFGDDRPTLFALVAHLPPGLTWDKVTITIDDVESQAPADLPDELNEPV